MGVVPVGGGGKRAWPGTGGGPSPGGHVFELYSQTSDIKTVLVDNTQTINFLESDGFTAFGNLAVTSMDGMLLQSLLIGMTIKSGDNLFLHGNSGVEISGDSPIDIIASNTSGGTIILTASGSSGSINLQINTTTATIYESFAGELEMDLGGLFLFTETNTLELYGSSFASLSSPEGDTWVTAIGGDVLIDASFSGNNITLHAVDIIAQASGGVKFGNSVGDRGGLKPSDPSNTIGAMTLYSNTGFPVFIVTSGNAPATGYIYVYPHGKLTLDASWINQLEVKGLSTYTTNTDAVAALGVDMLFVDLLGYVRKTF